jgi:hypothetical protein
MRPECTGFLSQDLLGELKNDFTSSRRHPPLRILLNSIKVHILTKSPINAIQPLQFIEIIQWPGIVGQFSMLYALRMRDFDGGRFEKLIEDASNDS